jgi:hypothetical protein
MDVRHGRNEGAAWQVDIEIGQLVLDGFDRIDPDAVTAAFDRELTRVLVRRTAPLSAERAADIELASRVARCPARQLPAGIRSGQLGRALAEAVFGVFGDVGSAMDRPPSAVVSMNVSGGTRGDGVGWGAPVTVTGAPLPRGAETAPR